MRSGVSVSPSESTSRPAAASTTSVPACVCTSPSRGASQSSSASRPTSQNRRAIASRSSCGRARQKPFSVRVRSTRRVHEGPVRALEARSLVAVDDVDAHRTVLARQRGPLVRALAAADDRDAAAVQRREVDQIARVLAGHVLGPRWTVREVRHARRGDDREGRAAARRSPAWRRTRASAPSRARRGPRCPSRPGTTPRSRGSAGAGADSPGTSSPRKRSSVCS